MDKQRPLSLNDNDKLMTTGLETPASCYSEKSAGLEGFVLTEDVGRKYRMVQEALDVPPGYTKKERVREVAEKYQKGISTVFKAIKTYKEDGLKGFKHTKNTKGQALAWTPEALEFWIGVCLKDTHRKIKKRGLYRRLKFEAEKQGWRIGSYSNACKKANEVITAPLIAYQKGGFRCLDNAIPSVLRDNSGLNPFEIIVGDQHRFDVWVVDSETGEVFRPEGYMWQCLGTRAFYGIALAKKYDSHLMALALRVGVYQFGLFKSIYTDNGKPELSRYITDIINDVKGYNLQVKETISACIDLNEVDPEEIQCGIRDSGQHIKAIVRNAKAKMIEGTFKVIEGALIDQALLPGYVKRLSDPKEYQEVDEKEVKRLAEAGQLPTFEEFYRVLLGVCDWYNSEKHHRGLWNEAPPPKPQKITPTDRIKEHMANGWRPTRIPEEVVDLLFLPKEPNPRIIDRGRIRFRNRLYEHNALIELTGQKVDLRFDPNETEYVLVFRKGEYLCRAETVEYSSMKDMELAKRKITEKAHIRKGFIEKYKRLTSGIPDIRQFSEVSKFERTAALIARDKRQQAIENKEMYRERTHEELAREVKALKEQPVLQIPQNIPEPTKRPEFFTTDIRRYEWILKCLLDGGDLLETDRAFKEEFEEKIDPEELEYWERRRELMEAGIC